MSSVPAITITFHPPEAGGLVPITLVSVSGVVSSAELRLPFALEHSALLLSAMIVRQHAELGRTAVEQAQGFGAEAVVLLRRLGLWTGAEPGTPADDLQARIGRMLGTTLLGHSALRRAAATLQEVAARVGEGELILHFDQRAAALAALPWELTYYDERPLLLAGQVVLSCTRVIAAASGPVVARPLRAALRVLALAPRAGFDEALRQAEREARRRTAEALRGLPVVIEELHPVSMSALRQRLSASPVDVIDWLGHGRFGVGGGELLLDAGPGGAEEWVSAERVAALPNLPPLMVLHACQAGRLSANAPAAGVAAALSLANVQAVVAMQLDNFATSAVRSFVPTLYSQIAVGRSVQRALAEARRSLFTDEHSYTGWYVPALYLRQPVPQPFRLLEPPPNPFAGLGALHDVRLFVGRPATLRRLWDRLRVGGNLAIIGPAESGKSTVLRHIGAEATAQLGPGVEALSLTIHRDLRRDVISDELATLLGGRRRSDLPKLLRGRRLILLLDDLGLLGPDRHGLDVRQWLRGLSQARVSGTVQLVVTSRQPLARIFADHSEDVSPLHNALRDTLELGPFDEVEARRFIAQRLQGTPFGEEVFDDLLAGSLLPGVLQEACRARYDDLYQRWE